MKNIETKSVINAIEYWSIHYHPSNDFHLAQVREIYADAGSQFTSSEFEKWAQSMLQNIVTKTAAPHLQSTNGLTENR
jgi:hypothetical protein